MKKLSFSLALAALLVSAIGCSNWNRVTPKPLDDTMIAEEIRKNLAVDGMTGMTIDVKDGVVTLKGHVKTSSDRQKAVDDARRVNGVKRVINQITLE
jgi:osmotically-inducible protein OsmY